MNLTDSVEGRVLTLTYSKAALLGAYKRWGTSKLSARKESEFDLIALVKQHHRVVTQEFAVVIHANYGRNLDLIESYFLALHKEAKAVQQDAVAQIVLSLPQDPSRGTMTFQDIPANPLAALGLTRKTIRSDMLLLSYQTEEHDRYFKARKSDVMGFHPTMANLDHDPFPHANNDDIVATAFMGRESVLSAKLKAPVDAIKLGIALEFDGHKYALTHINGRIEGDEALFDVEGSEWLTLIEPIQIVANIRKHLAEQSAQTTSSTHKQMLGSSTLDQLCDCAIHVSMNTQGRPTDWRGAKASVLFAKLCMTCIGFLRFIPNSSFYVPAKSLPLLDLSSAASLCRNLIEAYYVLLYVSATPQDEEDCEFRQALWDYHTEFERYEMLRVALPSSKTLPKAVALLAQCRTRLEKSPVFQRLSKGHQAKLLEGDSFKLSSSIELSRAAGISEKYYRAQYKYCSTFAHSSPYSISQMESLADAPDTEHVWGMLVNIATGYTALAIRDFIRLFPDQEDKLPDTVKESISLWEDMFKWEKLPWFDSPN